MPDARRLAKLIVLAFLIAAVLVVLALLSGCVTVHMAPQEERCAPEVRRDPPGSVPTPRRLLRCAR